MVIYLMYLLLMLKYFEKELLLKLIAKIIRH